MYLIILVLSLISTSIFAARPLVTDDASTMGAGLCQFEGWLQKISNPLNFGYYPLAA